MADLIRHPPKSSEILEIGLRRDKQVAGQARNDELVALFLEVPVIYTRITPKNMIAAALISVIVAFASLPAFAGDFLLFPKSAKDLSAETLPYSQMLHTGVENDTFYLRGRFGVDFNFAGYRFGDIDTQADQRNLYGGKDILFGISAAAHINMRPTSGMRFPVDNFYALLALHLSGNLSDKLSWRLYPVHHVSAHLADGHRKDTVIIVKPDSDVDTVNLGVRAVSTEMARGELYYKPWGEIAEFGVGFGYHYHVCSQKNLLYRADLSILLKPPSPYMVMDGELSPYALIRVENVRQGADNLGATASAGVILRRAGRGFGVSVIYFNRPHTGYYFDKYEKGAGVEYTFLL